MTHRLLSREEAAAYCGVRPDQFTRYVRQGIMPQKITRTTRWDKHAIDAAIDRLSGLTPKGQTNDDTYARWARQYRK